MFEPSITGFLGYYLGFCARYFAVCGAIYWIFHVAFRDRWLAFRIQNKFPGRSTISHEIRWSLLNAACTGLSTMLIYHLMNTGRTSMYFSVADYGLPYFAFSAFLCVLGYDTWIYWQHRLLHTPWWFKHVHSVHHRVANPTAFAAFAHHPGETFMGNVYFISFLVFVPMHPLALVAAGGYMYFHGIMAHMGYEFYPAGFTRHPVLGWFNAATHHNMHHTHVGCNYGNWFNFWDYFMGTNHPSYHDTFDAVRGRVAERRLALQQRSGSAVERRIAA